MLAFSRATSRALVRGFAEKAASDQMRVRMYTPTMNILDNSEEVENIIYDSLDGGKSIVNSQFMPVQTTVRPGLIEVHMKNGQIKKYVHIGGVLQKTISNNVDIALFEAYRKEDIDWEELKKSEVFTSEPVGDSTPEADYLRRLGTSLRDDVGGASTGIQGI